MIYGTLHKNATYFQVTLVLDITDIQYLSVVVNDQNAFAMSFNDILGADNMKLVFTQKDKMMSNTISATEYFFTRHQRLNLPSERNCDFENKQNVEQCILDFYQEKLGCKMYSDPSDSNW
jgi:hypothetical protein